MGIIKEQQTYIGRFWRIDCLGEEMMFEVLNHEFKSRFGVFFTFWMNFFEHSLPNFICLRAPCLRIFQREEGRVNPRKNKQKPFGNMLKFVTENWIVIWD